MHLYKLWNVFVQIVKCTCLNFTKYCVRGVLKLQPWGQQQRRAHQNVCQPFNFVDVYPLAVLLDRHGHGMFACFWKIYLSKYRNVFVKNSKFLYLNYKYILANIKMYLSKWPKAFDLFTLSQCFFGLPGMFAWFGKAHHLINQNVCNVPASIYSFEISLFNWPSSLDWMWPKSEYKSL